MVEVNLIFAGIIAVLIGIALLFTGIILQSKGKTKVEGGGIVFIGPIPIIGATSEKALYAVIALSVIFLLLFIILQLGK
jgi:uncharacterized protein (TIGR00304 family)